MPEMWEGPQRPDCRGTEAAPTLTVETELVSQENRGLIHAT